MYTSESNQSLSKHLQTLSVSHEKVIIKKRALRYWAQQPRIVAEIKLHLDSKAESEEIKFYNKLQDYLTNCRPTLSLLQASNTSLVFLLLYPTTCIEELESVNYAYPALQITNL